MKYLLITLSLLLTYPWSVKSQAIEDTIIANYLEKVGYEALSNMTSYVYFYQSYNKYEANVIFNDKKESEKVLFYKRNNRDTLYRSEMCRTPGSLIIYIWNDGNSTLTFIKNNEIEYLSPKTNEKKKKFIDLSYSNYTFNISHQVKKALDENNLKYEGESLFDGIECYNFLLINDVEDKRMYFEKDTYLLIGSVLQNESKTNIGTKDVYLRLYKDYVDIEGVLIPKTITTYKNGEFWDSFIFKTIKFNIELEDEIFYDALNTSIYSIITKTF